MTLLPLTTGRGWVKTPARTPVGSKRLLSSLILGLALSAACLSDPARAQDGASDTSSLLDVEAEQTPTKNEVRVAAKRTSYEFFALPYKLFSGDAVGTGLSAEVAVPGWPGIRLGLTGHRSLSQNDSFYLTDWYLGGYSKFFFSSPLYRYGVSPFLTAGIGMYRVIGEAIDKNRREDETVDSTSFAVSGGVHYQYNKRFAGYGEYQLHSGEGSINSFQLGLSVFLL